MPKDKRTRKERARLWCFTLNNYTEVEVDGVKQWIANQGAQYVGFGKEVGENKTPHIQGFVLFYNPRELAGLKKINKRMHWEICRGDFQQNKVYCSKQGDYWGAGIEPVGRGTRTDLDEAVQVLQKEKSFPEFVKACPNIAVKYFNNMQRVHQIMHKADYTYAKPETFVLWGPTGTNKTRRFMERASELKLDLWKKSPGTGQWFDGYNGEEIILLDDFRGNHWQFSSLLEMLDGYGSRQQTKGGTVMIKPKFWFITSDRSPRDWYKIDNERVQQLFRRLKYVYHSDQVIDWQNPVEWVP